MENSFTLLLRKSTNIIIAPKGIQQIGISFAPERLGEYAASVQVRSGEWDRENICFCFCTSDLFHSLVYLFEVYILFDSTWTWSFSKYSFSKYSFSKYSFSKYSFSKYSFSKYSLWSSIFFLTYDLSADK